MYFDRNIQLKPANKNFLANQVKKIRPIICAIKSEISKVFPKVLVLYFKRHEK